MHSARRGRVHVDRHPGGAPSRFSIEIATFFTIEGGKIVRDATYSDRKR